MEQIEIGYEFLRNGKNYCLIDIVDLNSKQYALFSIEESGHKMNFEFCEMTRNSEGYFFDRVTDDNINNLLFEKMERSAYGEK